MAPAWSVWSDADIEQRLGEERYPFHAPEESTIDRDWPLCYDSGMASKLEQLAEALRAAGLKLATAESCTGGLVGGALTSVPGSSAWYLGGVVAYAHEVKSALLGVPESVLARYGAVSPQTARAMAQGVLERTGADVAVSVTGIAGPGGGTARKPVGLVYIGLARKGRRAVAQRFLSNAETREGVREETVRKAIGAVLGMLR